MLRSRFPPVGQLDYVFVLWYGSSGWEVRLVRAQNALNDIFYAYFQANSAFVLVVVQF